MPAPYSMRAPMDGPAAWISAIDMGIPPWTKKASRLGSTTIHFSHSGARARVSPSSRAPAGNPSRSAPASTSTRYHW